MPTRYLKPGIRDSATIDNLSPVAEILYYRLLVTVDDFGRYDARPAMIKSQCFPVKDSMTPEKCQKALQELADAGMILAYSIDGKPYLQIQKWDNKPRATESHFPAYSDTCIQTYTDVKHPHTNVPLTVTVTKTETVTETETGFAEFWAQYPKRVSKQDAAKAWKAGKCERDKDAILAAVAKQRESPNWRKDGGQFIPHPATYLNRRRWEDSIDPMPELNEQERLEASNRAIVDRLISKEIHASI